MPNFTKTTDEAVIEALLLCRGVISDTARMLGLKSSSSLRTRIKKNPILNAVLEDARDEMKDLAENRLFQAIDNGEQWAILFYLKSIARDRGYNDTKDINITGNTNITFEWVDNEDNTKYEETPSQESEGNISKAEEI